MNFFFFFNVHLIKQIYFYAKLCLILIGQSFSAVKNFHKMDTKLLCHCVSVSDSVIIPC